MPTTRPRNRQTMSIPRDQWEVLMEVAPNYGAVSASDLVYKLIENFLTQEGYLVEVPAPPILKATLKKVS